MRRRDGGRARRGRGRRRRRAAGWRSRSRRASAATSTSTPSRWPRTRSRPARRSRSCSPDASRSTCRPTPRPARRSTASALYRALRRVNPSPYLFFVRTPSFEVVGASPELLLQVEGDRLTTHPIAGTRPRGADATRGRAARRAAPARPEGAGRARDARRPRPQRPRAAWRAPGTVTVSKYMEVERYSHVLHLVSHVEGRLRPDLDALDALRAVFPAGTLSGRARRSGRCSSSPPPRASGAGCTAARSATSATTATSTRRSRSGAPCCKDGQAHVHTGAGIVAGSRPGARVRGDRAQGGRAAPGDRAGGRRPGGAASRDADDRTPRPADGARSA